MWNIIDFISISALALFFILPIYFSIKKANNLHLKSASISAMFAPISIIAIEVISVNLEPFIRYRHSLDGYSYYIGKCLLAVIDMVSIAFFYYLFTRKNKGIFPKFLFFLIPGLPMMWTFLTWLIQSIVIAKYTGSESLDTMLEVTSSLTRWGSTIALILVSYFAMRKLFYAALSSNNGCFCKLADQEETSFKKNVSIVAIFAPIVILIDIGLELFLKIYSAYTYGTKQYETHNYYLYMGVAKLFVLIFCLVLFTLFLRRFRFKLPITLSFIAFGVSPIRSFFENLTKLLYENEAYCRMADLISLIVMFAILPGIGYLITKDSLLKFINQDD